MQVRTATYRTICLILKLFSRKVSAIFPKPFAIHLKKIQTDSNNNRLVNRFECFRCSLRDQYSLPGTLKEALEVRSTHSDNLASQLASLAPGWPRLHKSEGGGLLRDVS